MTLSIVIKLLGAYWEYDIAERQRNGIIEKVII